MKPPDSKPERRDGVDAAQQRIGRALTRAYEPVLEEPVPPTLARMAERLDPRGSEQPAPSLLQRARCALRFVREMLGNSLPRK